jgi:hypothetical protein
MDAGEPTEDAAPTELAGVAEAETQSAYAWGLADDDLDLDESRPRLTAGLITGLAVSAAVVLVAGAAVVGFMKLRRGEPAMAAAAPSVVVATVAPPPPAVAAPVLAPPTTTHPPTPVALSARGGSVFVKTRSGKTVCQVTAGTVLCNVDFTRATPTMDGMPASGVSVTTRGDWQWLYGDPGNPDYNTLAYGQTYQAFGWTITPTSGDTTFMHDSTGHGMTVSVEGFETF